jgi:hypothetical protein
VELSAMAGEQHGVVGLKQMISMGWTHAQVQKMALSFRWRRVMPGVYGLAAGDAWKQRLMAACLSVGPEAVASHQAAAKLHGLDNAKEEIHVSVSSSRRPRLRKGIALHRARELGPESRTVREGIPCTSLVRTLVDLSGLLSEQELAYVFESAWRKDSGLLEDIEPWLEKHGRGLEGMAALRRVVDDCLGRSHKPMDSTLEVRLWRWLKEVGLPLPHPQEPYTGHGDYVRFIDFAYMERMVALETDGFEFHRDRESFEKDAAKLSYLAAQGWRVIHVTWRMLDTKPMQLKKWIQLALARR